MLASRLCVFDDKTDSKSKWVNVYFMKISICDADKVKESRIDLRN